MDGNSVKRSDIFSKLKDKNLIVPKGYINGSFTSGEAEKTFDVKDPSNGDLIISLPDMGIADTKLAIESASKAQKSWACLLYTSPSPRDS